MLYILNQTELIIDNNKNQLNINGYMNDNSFSYNNFNLDIVLTDYFKEKIANISCNTTMQIINICFFECRTKNEITGSLDSAYSNLGDANLIVSIPQQNDNYINFKEKRTNYNSDGYSTEKDSKLSGGIIALIVIACVFGFIIIIVVVIYWYKKRSASKKEAETGTTMMRFSTNNYI